MNEITNQIVMSSVEICEVLRTNGIADKRHDHIMRDIDKMMGDISPNLGTSFEGTYLDAYGREQRCWYLGKDHALCLVAGYSAKIRMAIINRMNELEQATKKPEITATSPRAQLFLELARQAEEIERQQEIIQEKTEDVLMLKGNLSNREYEKLLNATDLSRQLSANVEWSTIEGNRRWNWNPSSHDIMNYLREKNFIFKNGKQVQQKCIDRYGDVVIAEPYGFTSNIKFNVHAEGFVFFVKEMKNFMIENKIGLTKSGYLPGIEW